MLTIDPQVIKKARKQHVNLSAAAEEGIAAETIRKINARKA